MPRSRGRTWKGSGIGITRSRTTRTGTRSSRSKVAEQISASPVRPPLLPELADKREIDYDDIARRKYKKDLDLLKPDLQAYNAQRLAATGSTSSALIASSLAAGGGAEYNQDKADDLYRDANSFIYADHKPSEDAIDKVIGKINLEYVHSVLSPTGTELTR